MRVLVLALVLICSGVSLASEPTHSGLTPVERHPPGTILVMVLGVTHFDPSGSDLINLEVDDVLAPERQRELEQVSSALVEFKPTVVVTERVTDAPGYVDPYYEAFDDAMLAKSRNERVQLAFRVARDAGVERVYGLDEQPDDNEPDYFPFGEFQAHLQATGQAEKFGKVFAEGRARIEELTRANQSLPIAQQLININSGEEARLNWEFYYGLSQYDVGESQPAAELQAYWFMRNAKIFSKLVDVTKPGDRVIIVYGAGHKYWLEHFVERTPGFGLIDPVGFLETIRSE